MAPIRTLVITKDSTQPIFVDMVGRWGVNWAAVHPYHVCVTGSGSVEIYKRDSKDIPKFPVKWEQGKGAISCEFRAALSSLLGGQWYIHPLDKMPSGMKPPMPKTLVHAKKEGNRPLQKTQDSSLKNRKATDRTPTGQVLVEKVNETANACTLYVVAFPYGAETIPVHNIIQAIHRSHRAQHPRDVLPEEETYIDLMMTVASELRGNDCEYAQTRHSLTPEIALKLLNRDMELLGRSMGYRITLGVVRDDGIKTVIGEVTNYVRVIWIWLRKPVYGDTNPMYSGCAALKALPPPEPSPAAPPEPVSLAMKIDSGTKTLDPAARYQLDFPHGAEAFESPHHVNEAIYQSHKAQHPNHDLKGQDKYNQLCFDKNNEFYKSMGLEPVLDHSSEHILSSFSYIVPRVGKQLGLRLALGIAYADGEKIFAGDVTRDTCIVWVLAERCSKCKSHPELCRGLEPLAALQDTDARIQFMQDIPSGTPSCAYSNPFVAIYNSHSYQYPVHPLPSQAEYCRLLESKRAGFIREELGSRSLEDKHLLRFLAYAVRRVCRDNMGVGRVILGIAYWDMGKVLLDELREGTKVLWIAGERCRDCRAVPFSFRDLRPLMGVKDKGQNSATLQDLHIDTRPDLRATTVNGVKFYHPGRLSALVFGNEAQFVPEIKDRLLPDIGNCKKLWARGLWIWIPKDMEIILQAPGEVHITCIHSHGINGITASSWDTMGL